MATIYMIHGFIGSGKTTFSKKLEAETKAVRFTPDEWMIKLYGENPPADKFAEYDEKIKELIWDLAEKVLNTNTDVILDFGFWKKLERDEARSFAESISANIKLFNLDCPEEIMRTRVIDRTEKMPEGALFINENTFNILKEQFEPIDPQNEYCTLIKTH